jgi:hypothetical protein
MSKLSDKIRKVTRLQSGPLGFGAAKAAQEPTMVLAARTADPAAAADLARRGADIVIVDLSGGVKPASADVPLGAAIAGKTADESTAAREAGYDFVVFDPDEATATALLDDQIGYVLALPKDLGDNETRTLESFQLDAIDVGEIKGALTVRRQIELRRIVGMARKPLMATVSADITSVELQALRDTSVVVVVAPHAAGVEKLRKTIDALPARRARKDSDERPTPLVPVSASVGDGDEPEHDHDHDE